MKDAAKTWALVVGIDVYDDSSIRPLEGAVIDALAAVDWLRRLGVPDHQILIHASPSAANRPALDAVRPGCPRAIAYEINNSIVQLEDVTGGSRLFIFLAGHGLYEATSGPLFLTQDFTPRTPTNLGINSYIRRFLAMGFQRQFLFLDGCQNLPYSQSERQKIEGSMYGGATGFTPRPGNTLVACFAAAQDQLAHEVGGRGLFSRYLFDGLDIFRPLDQHPCSEALDLNFDTGEMTVDLNKLFYRYIQSNVQEEASEQPGSPVQTPQLFLHGFTGSESHPVTWLPSSQTVSMELDLDPPAAVNDIQDVQLLLSAPCYGSLRLPVRSRSKLEFPVVKRLPIGARGTALYSVRRGSLWNPAQASHSFEGTTDLRFTFRLQTTAPPQVFSADITRGPRGPGPRSPVSWEDDSLTAAIGSELPGASSTAAVVKIRTVSADGQTLANMFDYVDAAREVGLSVNPREGEEIAPGVEIFHHETGPDLRILRSSIPAGRRAVLDWTRAIQVCSPPDVGVLAVIPPELDFAATLRIDFAVGGAEALAGVLANRPAAWIGSPDEAPAGNLWRGVEGVLSLRDLEAKKEFPVDPGPVLFRLDLPWGSWTRTVWVPPAGESELRLPEKVGTPPLRVSLREELERGETLVLGVPTESGTVPAGRVRRGLAAEGTQPLVMAEVGSAAWALQPAGSLEESWKGNALAELSAPRACFPLLEGRALAVAFPRGGLRVEPLSSVPMAAWDLLMSGGRLDVLTPEDASTLLKEKKADPLLALAAAYAVHVSPAEYSTSFQNGMQRHLQRIGRHLSVPDLDLLAVALAARERRRKGGYFLEGVDAAWFRQTAAGRLEEWAERGSVPVLRWGIPLAVQILELAEEGSVFHAWRESLSAIERRMSPTSVWTAWLMESGDGHAVSDH